MKIEEFIKTISEPESLKRILLEGLVVGFGYALFLLVVGIPSLLLDFKNFQYITLHQIIYSLITGVTYFGIWGILFSVFRPLIINSKRLFVLFFIIAGGLAGFISWLIPTHTGSLISYIAMGSIISSVMLLDFSWWSKIDENKAK